MNTEKYNRHKFIDIFINNSTPEVDFDSVGLYFEHFKMKHEYSIYTVTKTDLKRPDIISFKAYRKVDYWWIIMRVNNIDDVWNDMNMGDELVIPAFRDIEDFYLAVKNIKAKQ